MKQLMPLLYLWWHGGHGMGDTAWGTGLDNLIPCGHGDRLDNASRFRLLEQWTELTSLASFWLWHNIASTKTKTPIRLYAFSLAVRNVPGFDPRRPLQAFNCFCRVNLLYFGAFDYVGTQQEIPGGVVILDFYLYLIMMPHRQHSTVAMDTQSVLALR